MSFNNNHLQRQYEGFLNTPLLWEGVDLMGLNQLLLPKKPISHFVLKEQPNLRLGKRVEDFVFFELSTHKHIKILLKNTQIQHQKQTIGEIDCILQQNQFVIHLEIVYKFYLYDPTYGHTEIEHWIGPNRKDTLVKKLNKLKEKQLPLLHNVHTKNVLESLNLKAEAIKQQVYFKAQLFVPYRVEFDDFRVINMACIVGFYIHFKEIHEFQNCKFFIPDKIDWLQDVQNQVDWLNFNRFHEKIEVLIQQKTAPLCWIKFPKGRLLKFFVVWWS